MVRAGSRVARSAIAKGIFTAKRRISQDLAGKCHNRCEKMNTTKGLLHARAVKCLPITLDGHILAIERLITDVGWTPGKVLLGRIEIIPVRFGFIDQ